MRPISVRSLCAALAVCAALPVASQPLAGPAESVPLSKGQRRVAAAVTALGGVATSTAVFLINNADGASGSPSDVALVVLAYPVGLALGSQLAGAAYGATAPLDASALDAALGTVAGGLAGVVAGGAAGGVVYAVQGVTGSDPEYNFLPAILAVGVGVPVAVWTSGRVASRSLRVAPAALAAPTGERSVGLSLRVGL